MTPATPLKRQTVALRLLLPVLLAAVFISAGWWLRYPGSVPAGWQHTPGSLASVVGKQQQGATWYYPQVEYQALGFSYQLNSTHAVRSYPSFDTSYPVAFDPQQPADAKLVDETPPDYFRVLFPAIGIVILLSGMFWYVRAVLRLRPKSTPAAEEKLVREVDLPAPSEELDMAAADTTVVEGPPAVPAAPLAGLDEISAVPIVETPLISATPAVLVQAPTEAKAEPAPPTAAEPDEASHPPAGTVITPAEAAEALAAAEPAPKPKKIVIKPKPTPKKIYVASLNETEDAAPATPRSGKTLKTQLKAPAQPRPKKAAKPKTAKPRAKPAAKAKTAAKTPAKKPKPKTTKR